MRIAYIKKVTSYSKEKMDYLESLNVKISMFMTTVGYIDNDEDANVARKCIPSNTEKI